MKVTWSVTTWCSASFVLTTSTRPNWQNSNSRCSNPRATQTARRMARTARLCRKIRGYLRKQTRKNKATTVAWEGCGFWPSRLFGDVARGESLVIIQEKVAGLSEAALGKFL